MLYFALSALLVPAQAFAAEGIELIGYGARQKGLAGADVADSRDAMAMSINPAGIVGLDSQFQAGGTLLLPDRGYDAVSYDPVNHPLVLVAPGHVQSGEPVFPVPNGGFIRPIDADSAWGVVVYGNGGVNTSYDFNNYKAPVYAPSIAVPYGPITLKGPGPLIAPSWGGPFGDGAAGIDLRQAFVSVDYARKFGPVTIGVAPTFVTQIINVQGLQTLAPYSWDPYHLSNNGYDWSFGGGVRFGLEYSILPNLRLGLAAATPMFMTPFGKYAGAIADHGQIDVPAHVNAGLAFDAAPDLTLMAGWKHIFYHAVHALGAPSFPLYYGQLGSNEGPGFGWRDTDMVSVGVEYRALKPLTLRLGYAYSTPMIGGQDITLNVLAPAISKHHVSGGFKYEIDKNQSIDFATVYAFKNTVSGPEAQPFAAFSYTLFAGPYPVTSVPVGVPPAYNPYTKVTAWLSGLEFSLSWSYKFDAAAPTPIAAKF
ncbi:MAG: outer membrane protein transport protein [Methylocystis sp.]